MHMKIIASSNKIINKRNVLSMHWFRSAILISSDFKLFLANIVAI